MNIPYCDYLKDLYGGDYYIRKTQFGDILTIKNDPDVFFINLTDKDRFGKFRLMHRGNRFLDGTYQKHVQHESFYLDRLITSAFTHHFYKCIGVMISSEDRTRLNADYRRWLLMQRVFI